MALPITAGALVGNVELGKGTVLSVTGDFAVGYFPSRELAPEGPWWRVDLAAGRTRLEEPSADQPEEPNVFAPYVIELGDEAALSAPRAPGFPFVYVGITRHAQSRRFATHKAGGIRPRTLSQGTGYICAPSCTAGTSELWVRTLRML